MSEQKPEDSAMGKLAGDILKDPDTQKALMDMTQPLLQMQEAVFQTIIDQQNRILTVLQTVIDSQQRIEAELAVLTTEVKQ